jgi:hypothetical protein
MMDNAEFVVQRWYGAEELSINPDMMELVIFAKRNKVDRFIESVLLDRMFCTSEGVKY